MGSSSTLVVIILRLAILLLPHIFLLEDHFPEQWLYSGALTSVFVHPHQTLSHIREAQSIRQLIGGRFVDAYKANQTIRLPPLLLAAMEPIANCGNPELVLALLLLLADILMAYMIESLGRKLLLAKMTVQIENEERIQKEMPNEIRPPNISIFPITQDSESLLKVDSLPFFAARIYFWSPITAMSGGVYGCFQNLSALFLMAALHEFFRTNSSYTTSAFFLAIASYITPHYFVYLIPLLLWMEPHQYPSSSTSKKVLILSYGIWSACLQALSYSLVGPQHYWEVLEASYGSGWDGIGPNLSVQWYLNMQLFARFREYFSTILLGMPFIVVIPLTIRLYQYPTELVCSPLDFQYLSLLFFSLIFLDLSLKMVLFLMLWCIFAPIQTLYETNFIFCFLILCPKSLARMEKIAFFALCSLFVPLILNIVDQWMWLETNTGNANYLFFQGLAWNVFLSIILAQFCSATLQRDKALRLTTKESKQKSKEE